LTIKTSFPKKLTFSLFILGPTFFLTSYITTNGTVNSLHLTDVVVG